MADTAATLFPETRLIDTALTPKGAGRGSDKKTRSVNEAASSSLHPPPDEEHHDEDDNGESFNEEDAEDDDDNEEPEDVNQAYSKVKQAQKQISNSRGSLQDRKKHSTCKDCGKKGHWAGDRECPRRKAARSPKAPSAGVHLIEAISAEPTRPCTRRSRSRSRSRSRMPIKPLQPEHVRGKHGNLDYSSSRVANTLGQLIIENGGTTVKKRGRDVFPELSERASIVIMASENMPTRNWPSTPPSTVRRVRIDLCRGGSSNHARGCGWLVKRRWKHTRRELAMPFTPPCSTVVAMAFIVFVTEDTHH
eukprot:3778719-Amphidinium_carterae.1